MQVLDILQLVVFFSALTFFASVLGKYFCNVLDPAGKTILDPVLKPVENFLYRACRIDPFAEQTWKVYLACVFVFSCISIAFTFAMIGMQSWLPFNPQNLIAPSWDLNLNTAVSFATNTNWQSYAGEKTMSYFSQMGALTVQNFISAAEGLACATALVRGIIRKEGTTVGNFWTDLTRITLYILLPISIVGAIILMFTGVPQNFSSYVHAETLEGGIQTIAQGPVASQEVIKLLGTNGGGFMGANSAHPYENPTPFSNLFEAFLILLLPTAGVCWFGRAVGNQKHGWYLFAALGIAILLGILIGVWAESRENPHWATMGIFGGNWEGKELRFGLLGASLYSCVTTAVNCGAANCAMDSLTPIGGMIPLLNMQLQDVIFGGVGTGLSSIIFHILLTIFIAGLVIGRTPEYLGKKIEAFDIKMTMLAVLVFSVLVHVFTSWACLTEWGLGAVGNKGPHGFSEILYAYTSATVNNGSAFGGLSANVPGYNLTLAAAMFLGRMLIFLPILGLAGSFVRKKICYQGNAAFPISNLTFMVLFIGIVGLVGALTFLPALAIGPILEQCAMLKGILF